MDFKCLMLNIPLYQYEQANNSGSTRFDKLTTLQ
jgi:hypothetical protein